MFCSKHTISVLLPTLSDGWKEGRKEEGGFADTMPVHFPKLLGFVYEACQGKRAEAHAEVTERQGPNSSVPMSSSTFLPTPY